MPARGQRIGAVLAQLTPDFPDLTISKLRFLEAEGLVEPERAPSGYRLYAPADIERVRFILTAQRDRFWPLKVIKDNLDAMDRGLTVDAGTSAVPTPPPVTADPAVPRADDLVGDEQPAPRLQATELAAATGAGRTLIDELVSFGLLRPDKQGYFAGESARIVAAAHDLGGFGIEARHLRVFRTAAEREVGLVDYAAAGASRPDPAAIAAACLTLHTALVKDELSRREA